MPMLVLALLVSALVPAGYMPASDGLWMQLCNGGGTRAVFVAFNDDVPAQEDHQVLAECPWAGLPGDSGLPVHVGTAAAKTTLVAPDAGGRPPLRAHRLVRLPPARAPPHDLS